MRGIFLSTIWREDILVTEEEFVYALTNSKSKARMSPNKEIIVVDILDIPTIEKSGKNALSIFLENCGVNVKSLSNNKSLVSQNVKECRAKLSKDVDKVIRKRYNISNEYFFAVNIINDSHNKAKSVAITIRCT